MNDVKPPKILILWTLVFFFVVSAAAITLNHETLPPAIEIDTEGQPTVGYPKAPVHVVVFEEPKCIECKIYNNTIFPKIKSNFIDTHKIRYTVIPVSFIPNSMPAAVALLCAYYQSPDSANADLFFSYLDYLYLKQPSEHTDWATVQKLQEMAKQASPALHLNKLKRCIERESFRQQIVANTDYGRKLMDGSLGTPAVYVDGILVDELSYDTLHDLIVLKLDQVGAD